MTFEQYHNENDEIWTAFVHYTNLTIHKGFKNYGAKGIFELIRWHSGATGTGTFKINNNYTADYARKFMEVYPKHEGFFRTKNRK